MYNCKYKDSAMHSDLNQFNLILFEAKSTLIKMSTTTTQTQNSAQISTEDAHKYDHKNLPKYEHPPETKESLPWAELVTLDLEDFHRPNLIKTKGMPRGAQHSL